MDIIIGFMDDMDYQKDFQEAISLIQSSGKILLVSHRRPDGDTLGANIGLHFALRQLGKNTTLACIDEIPRRLRFLKGTEKFVQEFRIDDFDLIIICDAGAYHMTGFHEKYTDFLSKRVPILNIDHHASNDFFGTVNLVDPKASSATVIVWRILKQLKVKFTPEIAEALLAGIYNDTGGFMHANTTKETFEAAADFMQTGISVSTIVKPLMKDATLVQLKLWGFMLENLHMNEKGVISSVVNQTDFRQIGARPSDTGGIVDLINTVPESSFTVLLAEDEGMVKGSLRTQRDDVDVDAVARQFGGGGHRKAAGFRIRGRIEKQTIWKIIPASVR